MLMTTPAYNFGATLANQLLARSVGYKQAQRPQMIQEFDSEHARALLQQHKIPVSPNATPHMLYNRMKHMGTIKPGQKPNAFQMAAGEYYGGRQGPNGQFIPGMLPPCPAHPQPGTPAPAVNPGK